MSDPSHPATSVAEYAAARGVDLTGGASTIRDEPFTTGQASLSKALLGGFAERGPAPSLDAFRAWQKRRSAQSVSAAEFDLAKEVQADPELRELVAGKLAKRAEGDHLGRTGDRVGAQHAAFAKYRELGGRKSFAAFKSGLGG